jgi:hypothetical protein
MNHILGALNPILINPDFIRKFHGDVLTAYVLSAVCQLNWATGPDARGEKWIRVSVGDLAEKLGLSSPQTRRALSKLVDSGELISQVRNPEPHDRTRSYALGEL